MALEQNFKEYSVAEFFKKNKQMLGFSGKTRSLTTIIHEYVTNSLDACEEHNILPNIRVELDEVGDSKYKVVVADNGPGLPLSLIGKALGQMLAGTKFHRHVQQRGQQGIGAAGCTMYAVLTTGKPVHVITGYKNKMVSCDISIDFKTNKPKIENVVESDSDFHGIIIEAEFGDVKFDKGQYGALEYIRRSAIANPHLSISLKTPDGNLVSFTRTVDKLPRKPKEIPPHPLGIKSHDMLEIAHSSRMPKLSQCLTTDLSRFSADKVKQLKDMLPDIDFSIPPKQLTWSQAEELVKAFKRLKWIAPRTDILSPIGKEQITKSLSAILNPEVLSVAERPPKVLHGGIPYQVEAAVAYGGGIKSKGEIMRFANRAPLLFDTAACAITQVAKAIDWKRYNLNGLDNDPLVVLVNVSSTYVPYTGAGKQAISAEEGLVDEIKNAIQEAARGVKNHIRQKKKASEIEKKRKAFLRYVEQLSTDLSYLANEDASVIKTGIQKIIDEKFGGGLNA
ncbi:MAG: DNA topoisomerase VI subunit B [Methanobacteriota archaeon]|nr:MAG: DNA topoisomerase VI subunit B [Euryarchaeota archaeon]